MVKSRRYRLGPITFDAESHALKCGEEERTLAPKASKTLEALVEASVENYGRLVNREFLMEKVWGGVSVTGKSLDVIIGELRKVLEECDPAEASSEAGSLPKTGRRTQRHIEVVHGTGFKYIGPAEQLPPDKLVIAVREPNKRNRNYFDALGIVRPVSNRLVRRSVAQIGNIIVKPVDAARYRMWSDEERELKADYVLNLESQKRGGIRKVSAQVLGESDRSLKCSNEFTASEEDVYDMLDEIARWVVDCLDQGNGR